MTTLAQDPKGYYAALGIEPGALAKDIKRAYHVRAKSVHPDRNPSPSAREEFQRLAEAYRILSHALHRAEYDATGVHPLIEDGEDYPSSPLACTCCGKVTAQPRYVIFSWVKSYLLWARTGREEGIFCRDCADRLAVRASVTSWTWGWWSLPGIVLTPMALIRNMRGGKKPRDANARLLIRQAKAFLAWDEIDISASLADQAARYARLSVHRRQIEDIRRAASGARRRLRCRWGIGASPGVFWAQCLPVMALAGMVVVGGGIIAGMLPWSEPASARAEIVVRPAQAGDVRYVALDDLKLRQYPQERAPVLTLLDRFSSVRIIESRDDGWSHIRSVSGAEGWVPTRALYAGSGSSMKQEWCAEHLGPAPTPGEILTRRAGGDHRLLVHNDTRQDAVVKLKTAAGVTVLSFFVPATYHLGVGGIPEGTYRIEFATGNKYSRPCGLFVRGMGAATMPFRITFRPVSVTKGQGLGHIPEITLTPTHGQSQGPLPLDLDRFTGDD